MPGQMSVTIQGHEIPAWAKCYCVKKHMPTYLHLLPYEMPGGNVLYLCPASHHALTVYMKLCEQLGGAPKFDTTMSCPYIIQRLGRLLWAVQQGQLTAEQYMRMETYQRLSKAIDNG